MTPTKKIIKTLAIVLAIFLSITIISSIVSAVVGVMFGITTVVKVGEAFSGIDNSKVATVENNQITNYKIDEIDEIDIKIAWAKLDIKTIDSEEYELKVNQGGNEFYFGIDDKKLIINQNDKKTKDEDNYLIELSIPKTKKLEKINIETGASVANIELLKAKEIKIENGAGEIIVSELETEKLKLEDGAGNVEIKNSVVKKSDVSAGAGKVTYKGKILEEGEFETGIGKMEIELVDTDYKIKPSVGIGKVSLNGEKCFKDQEYGTGDINIRVDVGIGEAEIITK